ncbi:uncharacterized protein LOC141915040 [Tubulanus polymorphus]|uniref:uncharacterized protein LOC141915040 n=1 Tax=Tubulanus polymorphus TaxID=672921 RepID=UPI003DA6C2C1
MADQSGQEKSDVRTRSSNIHRSPRRARSLLESNATSARRIPILLQPTQTSEPTRSPKTTDQDRNFLSVSMSDFSRPVSEEASPTMRRKHRVLHVPGLDQLRHSMPEHLSLSPRFRRKSPPNYDVTVSRINEGTASLSSSPRQTDTERGISRAATRTPRIHTDLSPRLRRRKISPNNNDISPASSPPRGSSPLRPSKLQFDTTIKRGSDIGPFKVDEPHDMEIFLASGSVKDVPTRTQVGGKDLYDSSPDDQRSFKRHSGASLEDSGHITIESHGLEAIAGLGRNVTTQKPLRKSTSLEYGYSDNNRLRADVLSKTLPAGLKINFPADGGADSDPGVVKERRKFKVRKTKSAFTKLFVKTSRSQPSSPVLERRQIPSVRVENTSADDGADMSITWPLHVEMRNKFHVDGDDVIKRRSVPVTQAKSSQLIRNSYDDFHLSLDLLNKEFPEEIMSSPDEDPAHLTSPRRRKFRLRSPRLGRKSQIMNTKGKELFDHTLIPVDDKYSWFVISPADLDVGADFEVQRIPEYDKYLHDLLNETDQSHPDYADLSKAAVTVNKMVKEREDEMNVAENEHKVESVQDRFPNDDLELHEKLSSKIRTLQHRRRSAPSAVLLKTLGGNKSLKNSSSSPVSSSKVNQFLADSISPSPPSISMNNGNKRLYILEGPVQLVSSLQTQDRYLFLFNDLLLVAKQRSPTSTSFKLKHRIRVCELWLHDYHDDCTTSDIPQLPVDRSFAMGWPMMNVIATFNSPEEKELWWNKIKQQIAEEKMREEPKSISIKVSNKDTEGLPITKVIAISNTDDANDCVRMCLEHYDSPDLDPKDYQIWVVSGKESAQCPLIGHENLFSIKMNYVRDAIKSKGDEFILPIDTDKGSTSVPAEYQCQFILKRRGKSNKNLTPDDAANQKKLKKLIQKKSPIITFFRKNKNSPSSETAPLPGKLFGHQLSDICTDDQIPKTLMDLFRHLYDNGPFVKGILRVSANAKICKELKDDLNNGSEIHFDDKFAQVTGSVIKDFFRSLPDAVMTCELYDKWVATNEIEETEERIAEISSLFQALPKCNQMLLQHLFCILHYIEEHSEDNNMTAYNLGVCISQSLLWPPMSAGIAAQADSSKKVPSIVEFMIEKCVEIFGEDVLKLFGDPPQPKSRQDSGTDSDSMHSMLSAHESGLHHDDSSMDSLDRELYCNEADTSPKLMTNHLSPSNLSRDSGLTLSDSQLYTEEGMDSETSSGNKSRNSSGDKLDITLNQCAETYPPVPPPRKGRRRVSQEGANIIDQRRFARLCAMPGNGTLASSMGMEKGRAALGGSPVVDSHRSRMHPLSKRRSNDSLQSVEENDSEFHRQQPEMGNIQKSRSGNRIYFEGELIHTGYSQRPQNSENLPTSPDSRLSYSSQDSLEYLDRQSKMSLDSQDSEPSTPGSPQSYQRIWPPQSLSSSYSEPPSKSIPIVHLSASYSGASSNQSNNAQNIEILSGQKIIVASQSAPCTPENNSPRVSPRSAFRRVSKTPDISPTISRKTASNVMHNIEIPPPRPPKPPALRIKGAGKITSPNVDQCKKTETLKVFGSPPPEVILRRGRAPRNKVYEFSPDHELKRHSDLNVNTKLRSEATDDGSLKRPNRPPTYQEAIQRKTMLNKGIIESLSDRDIIKQSVNSAHARQLYEDSIKMYMKEHDGVGSTGKGINKFKGSYDSSYSDEENSSSAARGFSNDGKYVNCANMVLQNNICSSDNVDLCRCNSNECDKLSSDVKNLKCSECDTDYDKCGKADEKTSKTTDVKKLVSTDRRLSEDSIKSDSSGSSRSSSEQSGRIRRPPPAYRPPPIPVNDVAPSNESVLKSPVERKPSGVRPPGDFQNLSYTEESYV